MSRYKGHFDYVIDEFETHLKVFYTYDDPEYEGNYRFYSGGTTIDDWVVLSYGIEEKMTNDEINKYISIHEEALCRLAQKDYDRIVEQWENIKNDS